MNPGIFYLYEYNNTQKIRNAGFLKITRYYHSCTLQLNARGIPVSYADTIKLYVFYPENNMTETSVLTEITCANHALSARMTSSESQFPGGRTLDKVDGFFLLLPNGHILAAAAPGITIDTQKLLAAAGSSSSAENVPDDTEASPKLPASDSVPEHAELEAESIHESDTDEPSESSPSCEEPDSPDEQPTLTEPDTSEECSSPQQESSEEHDSSQQENSSDGQDSPNEHDSSSGQNSSEEQCSSPQQEPSEEHDSSQQQEPSEEHDSSQQQEPSMEHDSSSQQNSSEEQCPPSEQDSTPEQNPPSEQESPEQCVRKIQRSELSTLPRKYWQLANNSFLLHGYHNYNHLILIEKDGHYWLGVPGIYDSHEARAARLFGFPQFTDSYNKFLDLSDDECNPNDNFGYWCCYLK